MQQDFSNNSFLSKLASAYKNNQRKILIILSIIVLSIFILIFYNNHKNKNNILISDNYNYANILLKKNNKQEAKILLESIIELKHKTYSPLALYLIIDQRLEDNPEKIINSFNILLKIRALDEEGLDLIKIKKSLYLFNILKTNDAIETLKPLISSNSTWKKTAIKIMAEYYNSKNEKIKAKEYYDLLKNN